MNYSPQILDEIQSLSELLTPPNDIAVILEIENSDFISELRDNESSVYKSFYRGFLSRVNKENKANLDILDAEVSEFSQKLISDFRIKTMMQIEK